MTTTTMDRLTSILDRRGDVELMELRRATLAMNSIDLGATLHTAIADVLQERERPPFAPGDYVRVRGMTKGGRAVRGIVTDVSDTDVTVHLLDGITVLSMSEQRSVVRYYPAALERA